MPRTTPTLQRQVPEHGVQQEDLRQNNYSVHNMPLLGRGGGSTTSTNYRQYMMRAACWHAVERKPVVLSDLECLPLDPRNVSITEEEDYELYNTYKNPLTERQENKENHWDHLSQISFVLVECRRELQTRIRLDPPTAKRLQHQGMTRTSGNSHGSNPIIPLGPFMSNPVGSNSARG